MPTASYPQPPDVPPGEPHPSRIVFAVTTNAVHRCCGMRPAGRAISARSDQVKRAPADLASKDRHLAAQPEDLGGACKLFCVKGF